ncbi:MAG: hypothetical protein VB122_03095 [Erysipelotrichales bacterium]|nr:hypothetical protein [Erysipelotrichales bacterium]
MFYFSLMAMIIIILSMLSGVITFNLFKLKEKKLSFATPIGFLMFMGLLQLGYMLITYFKIDFAWFIYFFLVLASTIVIISVVKYKWFVEYFASLKFKKMGILLGLVLFITVIIIFKNVVINFRLDDMSFYGSYIPDRIINNQLSNISYDYQGFFTLTSVLLKIGKELSFLGIYTNYLDLGFVVWVPAIISIWMFSFAISDFLYYVKNKYKADKMIVFIAILSVLIIFSDQWYISFPHFGSTLRRLPIIYILILSSSLFNIEKNVKDSILLSILISAFLSFSSSAFFLIIMFLSAFLIYSMITKRTGYLLEIAIMGLTPSIFGGIYKPVFGKVFILIYLIVIFLYLLKINIYTEKILNRLPLSILIITPIFMIYFTYLSGKFPDLDFPYVVGNRNFFTPINNYDMVPDLLNFKGIIINSLFNGIFWILLGYFIFKGLNRKKWLSWLVFILCILFFNPFVFRFVSYFMTSVVYFRITDLLFNVVIIFEVFLLIYQCFGNKVKPLIILLFAFFTILKLCQISVPNFKVDDDYNYLYHTKNSELELVSKLENDYFKLNYDNMEQINIASHIYGIQLFSNYNLNNLLNDRFSYAVIENDEFEKIFFRRQPTFEDYEVDYERACYLASTKELEYVILDAQYNWKLQEGLWPCSEVLFEYENYRILKLNYDYWEWNKIQGYTEAYDEDVSK